MPVYKSMYSDVHPPAKTAAEHLLVLSRLEEGRTSPYTITRCGEWSLVSWLNIKLVLCSANVHLELQTVALKDIFILTTCQHSGNCWQLTHTDR